MKKIVLMVCVMFNVVAIASPILQTSSTTWGTGPFAYYVSPTSSGNISPALSYPTTPSSQTVAFNFTAASGMGASVRLADTSDKYVGDFLQWGDLLTVNFTIKNLTANPPNLISMYYISAEGNTNTTSWVIDQIAISSGDSMTFSRNIGAVSSWSDSVTFLTDFDSITQFGFDITGYAGTQNQSFEISNTYFTVPEPETYAMILVVLASLGITFRSRLMELAGQAKARIRA